MLYVVCRRTTYGLEKRLITISVSIFLGYIIYRRLIHLDLNQLHEIAGSFIPLHEGSRDIKKESPITVSNPPPQPIAQVSTSSLGADNFKSNNISGFKTYVNGRFGFSILYPQNFVSNKPPANGDGLRFTSPDGNAALVAYGSNNANFSLQELYNMEIKNIKGELGYKDMGDNW